MEEINTINQKLETQITNLKTQTLLKEEEDPLSAIITINAGAGGTESCDWALMLQRMYFMYCEAKGFTVSIFDELAGEETGIKNISFEVRGDYAYGLLKGEAGVHRLIRISPFDSNARRHTSFASVDVTPIVDDTIVIDINPSDIRIDTYRSTGAGGQHINTTDSAVRITHFPTGIVVQCQNERSQHQNKDQAFKLLRSKLYEREIQERLSKKKALDALKTQIGWSSQIRTYTLHPYKLVKDHRTSCESSNPEAVLNGKLDDFIDSYLNFIHSID